MGPDLVVYLQSWSDFVRSVPALRNALLLLDVGDQCLIRLLLLGLGRLLLGSRYRMHEWLYVTCCDVQVQALRLGTVR